jgi:hypothetical protein
VWSPFRALIKRPRSSGTVKGCPLKSSGSATVAGSRGWGEKHSPHTRHRYNPKKNHGSFQSLRKRSRSPMLDPVLNTSCNLLPNATTGGTRLSFKGLWLRSGKEIPKTRGSQQELGHSAEFASIKNHKSISLLNRRLHSSKYNKRQQTKTCKTSKGRFNFACAISLRAARAPAGGGTQRWIPG